VTSRPDLPIKDQGIVKSPVRIGPGSWIGTKVTVLRGTQVGRGCVLAAHAVVRGQAPDHSVLAGVPATVVKSLDPRAGAGGPRA
jgi:acetyltransferase-like isoleucine patch superfamily enzyme